MFRHGPGVAGADNIKASLSLLCNNGVIPSDIWRVDTLGSHITQGHDVYSALIPWLVLRLPAWTTQGWNTLNHPLSGVVFLSVISLPIFVRLWRKSGKRREARGASCGILARPQSQFMCKWLQVMRKGCPFSILPFCCFISLQPRHFCKLSVLNRLSLADSRDIRQ